MLHPDQAALYLYEAQAWLCQVLAMPKRLRLLHALRDGERSVGDLAVAIDASYPNASQHRQVLRKAGVTARRRNASTIHYRLLVPRLLEACHLIGAVMEAQHAAETPATARDEG